MALTTAERQRRSRDKLAREEKVRVDLHLPAKLHRRLQVMAKKDRVTLTARLLAILEKAAYG